jgi:hypothetical protein
MASINVGEEDFSIIAQAANAAMNRGDEEAANALDKIARKINAVLSGAASHKWASAMARTPQTVSWQDMPSTLFKDPTHV